ncbi:MAG: ornithine cyclodeaminase family protein, partial [Chloroflexota bacterium]
MTLRFKSDVAYWPGDRTTEEKYCVAPGTFLGLIMLFSTANGEPLALMQDGYIQHMRMATSATLGVKHLARPDAASIGVLGSGGMARTFIPAICTVRE